jgi:hypothetical protein
MRIEDMVEGLNKHIEAIRVQRKIITDGHLVFQLTIAPHETIKAYKKYEAIVWFVKGKNKYKVTTVKQVAKVVEGEDKYIMRVINIDLSKTLFSIINTKMFQEIIEGIYNGDTNE